MTINTPAKKRRRTPETRETRRKERSGIRRKRTRRETRAEAATRRRGRSNPVAARPSKKETATTSTFGADLIEGLKQVVEYQRGKIELEQVWPKPVDVKAIRRQTKLSQAEFSRAYGISKRALQEWEQGGRQPDQTARAYLAVIAKEPALVRRALARE